MAQRLLFVMRDKQNEKRGFLLSFECLGRSVPWLAGQADLLSQAQNTGACFIGASEQNAMNAERSALFRAYAWAFALSLPSKLLFFVDNKTAGLGSPGHWNFDLHDPLAKKRREVQSSLSAFHEVCTM